MPREQRKPCAEGGLTTELTLHASPGLPSGGDTLNLDAGLPVSSCLERPVRPHCFAKFAVSNI